MQTFYQLMIIGVFILILFLVMAICRKRQSLDNASVLTEATVLPVKDDNTCMKTRCLPIFEVEVYTSTGIKSYPLTITNRPFIIGSDRQCDLYLEESAYVSKKHAAISYDIDMQSYVLYDLNSVNGIYTQDGRRISEIKIVPDVQINIANVRICFKRYHGSYATELREEGVKTKLWKAE